MGMLTWGGRGPWRLMPVYTDREAGEGVPGEGHQVSTGTEAGKCQVEVEGKTRAAWLGQELVGSTRNSAREAGASSGALGVRNQVAPS